MPSAWASLHPEGTVRPRALIQFPTSLLSPASLLLFHRMSYRNSWSGTLPGGSFDGVQGRTLRSHIEVRCFNSHAHSGDINMDLCLLQQNRLLLIYLLCKYFLFCVILCTGSHSCIIFLSLPAIHALLPHFGAVCYCDMLFPFCLLSFYWVLCICYWFIHHFDLWAAELWLKKVIIVSTGRACCRAQGCNLVRNTHLQTF